MQYWNAVDLTSFFLTCYFFSFFLLLMFQPRNEQLALYPVKTELLNPTHVPQKTIHKAYVFFQNQKKKKKWWQGVFRRAKGIFGCNCTSYTAEGP